MRKIYLLLICMLAVSVSYAQVKNTRIHSGMLSNPVSKGMVNKKDLNMQKSTIQIDAAKSDAKVVATGFNSVQEAIQARQKALQAPPFIQYLSPAGTFYYGYTRDFKAYQNYLLLYTPAMKTLDYIPYSDDATLSWVLPTQQGDLSLADETDDYGILHWVNDIIPAGYYGYIPKVTATAGGESASYQLGQGVSYRELYAGNVERDNPANDGTDLGTTAEFPPLTLANLQANKPADGNIYNGFTTGGFSPSYTHAEYGPCTGVMQILPQMVSPFYAESVSVLAYTASGNAMPAGGKLKIQFYYLTEDDRLGELIAESTTDRFVKTSGQNGGVFVFTFEEEEDGFVTRVPLILGTKAPVAVVLSGFDATWDFSVMMGVNGSLPGSAYTLHGNYAATFGFSNDPNLPRADVYFQFNGIFNCLSVNPETSKLEFPTEGGLGFYPYEEEDGTHIYNDIDINSSFGEMDDIWVVAPDWITQFYFDDSYFEDYNIVAIYAEADPLPAGQAGRNGEIVFGSYGVTTTVKVKQGDAPWLGIPSVKPVSVTKAVRQGDSFQLTYPQGTTSVAVYSVTGQKMGEYKLNANGTTSIPAGNWAKGVYVLKFAGKTSGTVKVIK